MLRVMWFSFEYILWIFAINEKQKEVTWGVDYYMLDYSLTLTHIFYTLVLAG